MSQLDDIQSAQKDLELCFLKKMDELDAQIQCAGPAKDTVARIAEEFRAFRELMFGMLRVLRKQIIKLLQCGRQTGDTHSTESPVLTGFPETVNEDCRALILEILHNKLDRPDKVPASIKVCHRLGAPNKDSTRSRPILVRFSSVDFRSAIWKAKSSVKGSAGTIKVFLTRNGQSVFSKARLHFGMQACWTQDGVIVVRSPDGMRHKVTTLEEFNLLEAKHLKKAETLAAATGGRPGMGVRKN